MSFKINNKSNNLIQGVLIGSFSESGGGAGGTDKGIWYPKTNTPDIFTLLTNSGEFAVIDGLDAGETYNFDFGGTKGGVVAFTIGDKVYFNGVIFQKQESYIPTADEIIYDKINPLLGSVKDVVDLKANQSTTYTKTEADNLLNTKVNTADLEENIFIYASLFSSLF